MAPALIEEIHDHPPEIIFPPASLRLDFIIVRINFLSTRGHRFMILSSQELLLDTGDYQFARMWGVNWLTCRKYRRARAKSTECHLAAFPVTPPCNLWLEDFLIPIVWNLDAYLKIVIDTKIIGLPEMVNRSPHAPGEGEDRKWPVTQIIVRNSDRTGWHDFECLHLRARAVWVSA